MSLTPAFGQALAALPSFAGGHQSLSVSEPGATLSCQLEALEPLGCLVAELRLETNRLAGTGADELRQLSERLSIRLNYLLEPIRPIELDAEQCTVQLRSLPPQQSDDGATYFELLAQRGGSLRLARFHKPSGAPRQQVPAQLTREVLLRLAGDLEQAV